MSIRNIVGINNGAPSNFPSDDFIFSFGIEELDVYRTVYSALEKFQNDINHEIVTGGFIDYLSSHFLENIILIEDAIVIKVRPNVPVCK